MKERDQQEFKTDFFGRVATSEATVFGELDENTERSRAWEAGNSVVRAAKDVPINPTTETSRHIVDLSSFSTRPAQGTRPDLDFEQRISILTHAMRSVSTNSEHEHRAFIPNRLGRATRRATLGGFLKLPFALLALPFKTKRATRSIKQLRALPVASAPIVSVVAPVVAPKIEIKPQAIRTPVIKVMSETLIVKTSFTPRKLWLRHVAIFAVIAIVVSLPLQALLSYTGLSAKAGAVAASAKEAVGGLRDAGNATIEGGGKAEESFGRAAGAFAETNEKVDSIAIRIAAMLTGNGDRLASGKRLLAAGEAAAKAGATLAAGYESIESSPATVAEKLDVMSRSLAAALPQLETTSEELKKIPLGGLPESFRAPFASIREDVSGTVEDLKRVTASSEVLLDAIGANGKRRYLVVFQNSRELRPTGGFIGSYALMDLKDGSIENIEIPAGGSYDLRGGSAQRIEAPEQLRLVNPRWEFQDANWFADFPTSAQSLVWFYEKSGGPTVDGVIAVTSNIMEGLLSTVGPMEMPEYGKTISAENFYLETQKSVELEYDRETNRPKQIISDMAPKLLKRLLDGGAKDTPKLASILGRALISKDIQVWFSDESAQAAAADFGWTGELSPPESGDFLAVVDTNIAGGKTDGAIKQDIIHETRVEDNGSIIDTVTITRTHRGVKGEQFTGVKNINYMRLYVPMGSELLSSDGFESPGQGYFLPTDDTLKPSTLLAAIEGRVKTHSESGTRVSEETGATVFGNWIQLEPGETRSVKLSYRLPFRLQDLTKMPVTRLDKVREALGAWSPTAALKLVVRKQPGATNRSFSSHIDLPKNWRIESSLPQEATSDQNGLRLKTELNRDLFVGALLVKDN